MDWILDNALWILFGAVFIWMHLKMHGGHGHGAHGGHGHGAGHGGCCGGGDGEDEEPEVEPPEQGTSSGGNAP